MSRKRKRYREATGREIPRQARDDTLRARDDPGKSSLKSNLPVLLSAFDGYSNTLAFLGEDSPLLSSGTYRRSGLSDNTELLTTAYRENCILADGRYAVRNGYRRQSRAEHECSGLDFQHPVWNIDGGQVGTDLESVFTDESDRAGEAE